jgi:NADH-quinone oxidoreductase subunit C
MEQSFTLRKINEQFADSLISTHSRLGQDTVVIDGSKILELAEFLKEDPELRFNFLMDLTAVDHWKHKPRFEVVYHFFSLENNLRLRVKVPVGEPEPEVATLSALWPGANWFEREVFDMFGIKFKDHPNLTRILMYPEFEGHPLRKDYPITKRQPLVGPKD